MCTHRKKASIGLRNGYNFAVGVGAFDGRKHFCNWRPGGNSVTGIHALLHHNSLATLPPNKAFIVTIIIFFVFVAFGGGSLGQFC